MESDAPTEDILLPGLLQLPNDLLIKTVSSLNILDLRRLARVNKRLSSFIGSYLTRYRYNVGILKLPDELLLEVAQHLSTQKDRSHFAQATLRFYPIAMNYVARYDMEHNGSSLLMYAARWNLKKLARKIIHLGGDIQTESGSEHGVKGLRLRPLSNAAYYGHKQMVRLLLHAGAAKVIDTVRVSLRLAIANGHEQIAVLLSQKLTADDEFREGGDKLLRLACEAKMAKLVKVLLERGPTTRAAIGIARDRSTLLHSLISEHAVTDDFVKRQFHEEVYQIATALLQHNANPDIYGNLYGPQLMAVTTRHLARGHPDPRVRLLLAKAQVVPAPKRKAANLRIERPHYKSTAHSSHGIARPSTSVDQSRTASLWDFLKSPVADAIDMEEEVMGDEY